MRHRLGQISFHSSVSPSKLKKWRFQTGNRARRVTLIDSEPQCTIFLLTSFDASLCIGLIIYCNTIISQNTFLFSSGYWTDKSELNPSGGTTGFDSQETKLPTYWNTPFSKVCLGMKVNGQMKFTLITSQASSLHSLIADGQYRSTSLGRNKWIALTDSKAYLQPNCNQEGFNTKASRRARVGILGNNENDCRTCDSAIGFGVDNRACGDLSSIRAMCYILVQWWSAFKWILKQHQNR